MKNSFIIFLAVLCAISVFTGGCVFSYKPEIQGSTIKVEDTNSNNVQVGVNREKAQ